MTRWFAFDEESADRLARETRETVYFQGGDALAAALDKPRTVVLAASSQQGEVLVVSIRHRDRSERDHISYQPSGFLGLSDSLVVEEEKDEPREERRRFWRRPKDGAER